MAVFLNLIAILEFIVGVLSFMAAKTSIHEVLGVLAIGFSFLTMGLAAVLSELQKPSTTHLAEGVVQITEHLGAMRRYYEPQS
jgi:Na+/phosphate symporter